MIVPELIEIYVDCMGIALPVAFTFFICNLVVNTILTAAFGGRLTFKR